ncbi:hypothetical protein CQW23_12553 [Capsicum baccatum]|uniref:Uncharacterized protein n=1 Tax=Capsicum baccatum TaxID=33114 RepID=A0A2G2WSX1_CAPBA|nr:hypothetical protein CQW23_12553 [Capsicum baccatum]
MKKKVSYTGEAEKAECTVLKLQAYKTRPKEFGALEFSAGNGKMSFSIVMVSARGAPWFKPLCTTLSLGLP